MWAHLFHFDGEISVPKLVTSGQLAKCTFVQQVDHPVEVFKNEKINEKERKK
jgi:hypothetical protein